MAIKDLNTLLKSMNPVTDEKKYVCAYQEEEGLTLIIEESVAREKNSPTTEPGL